MTKFINPTRPQWGGVLPGGNNLAAFLKFVVVGLTQNAVFYGVTLLLLQAGLKAWQATVVFYPIAVLVSFLANHSWSFADRGRDRGQLVRYICLYVLVYLAAIALNWVQEANGIASWLASLLTMAAMAGVLFLALNFWVFRERRL